MPQWFPSDVNPTIAATYQSPYTPQTSTSVTSTTDSIQTITSVSQGSIMTYSVQNHDDTLYPYDH